MKLTLTPQMRKAGWTTINGHTRKPLSHAVEGTFHLHLAMDPPTATHHDKEIGQVFGKGGVRHSTLRNSPALQAAWTDYLTRIHERRELVPLMPPVKLWVTFGFRCPPGQQALNGQEYVHKPDLDNSVKVLKDVLAIRGFLVADEHVSREDLRKVWSIDPFVHVTARSLNPAGDAGELVELFVHHTPYGVICPAHWKSRQDVRTTELAANGQTRALELGTPGPGPKKPDHVPGLRSRQKAPRRQSPRRG